MDKENLIHREQKIIFILLVGISLSWINFISNLCKPIKIDYINETPSQILTSYNKKGVSLLNKWYTDKDDLDFALKYLGRDFPDIKLKNVLGNEINNNSLKHKKSLILIGATYCENCKNTSKALSNLDMKDVQSFYIFPKDNLADTQKYYSDLNIKMQDSKVILGSQNPTMSLVKDLGIKAVPLILFVDEKGKISYVHLGSATKEELITYKDRAFGKDKIYKKIKTKW